MAIDSQLRMKVEAQLRLGKTPKELSEKFGLPYITIQNWRKKLEAEVADNDVTTLIQTDEVTLHAMAEEIKARPMPVKEMEKSVKVINDAIGLQRLEEKTRSLSMRILDGVELYMAEESLDHTLDLKTLREAAGIVSTLHSALFNKNTTNVNVMNNNTVSGEKREIFKSSLSV